jgi:hypothetical protein
MFVHALGPFGDITGQVSDPFQVRVDFQYGGNSPQVGCDWLMQGQDLQAILFDANFRFVDNFVGVDDFAGQFNLLLAQSTGGFVNHLFNNAKHRHQAAMQKLNVIL